MVIYRDALNIRNDNTPITFLTMANRSDVSDALFPASIGRKTPRAA